MKRLLLATTDRQSGGMQRALRAYLNVLVQLGQYRVTVAAPASELYDHARQLSAIDVVRIEPVARWQWRRLGRLPAQLDNCQFDVALSHNGFACGALRHCADRVIGVCHNDKLAQFAGADELIVLTPAQHRNALSNGWLSSQCLMLPHFYEAVCPQFEPKQSAPLRIGAAGRMVKKKNFDLFVDAAQMFANIDPMVEFVLAGDGPLSGHLQRRASRLPNLSISEWVDIHRFAQSLDIFVSPSTDEPFGYVLTEMLDHGVAVVACATNGAQYILDQGRAGMLLPEPSPAALTNCLTELVVRTDDRAALQRRGFERARSDTFSRQRFAQALSAWLEQPPRR